MNKTEALTIEARVYEMCKEAIEATPDGLDISNVAGYKDSATVFLTTFKNVETTTHAVRCLEINGWERAMDYVSMGAMAMTFSHDNKPHGIVVYCSDLDGAVEEFSPECIVIEDHKMEKDQRIVCAYE